MCCNGACLWAGAGALQEPDGGIGVGEGVAAISQTNPKNSHRPCIMQRLNSFRFVS